MTVVIAAAGIGKRVGANIPKQYLPLLGKPIIEHAITPFLDHPQIKNIVVSLAKKDTWFSNFTIATHPKIKIVLGGAERVDSVLAALKSIPASDYVLVHDGARPCLQKSDIDKLIASVLKNQQGAILASQVRDTMKRSDHGNKIIQTVERDKLWHALTPQMFLNSELTAAILGNKSPEKITDEASAIEMAGGQVNIVEGRADNLKVTRQEDLRLAAFYLTSDMLPEIRAGEIND